MIFLFNTGNKKGLCDEKSFFITKRLSILRSLIPSDNALMLQHRL